MLTIPLTSFGVSTEIVELLVAFETLLKRNPFANRLAASSETVIDIPDPPADGNDIVKVVADSGTLSWNEGTMELFEVVFTFGNDINATFIRSVTKDTVDGL